METMRIQVAPVDGAPDDSPSAPHLPDEPEEVTKGTDTSKIPLLLALRFSLPAFATTSLSLLISVYAVDFYVSMGTKIAFLSFFTALARSFDVITDPLMGWLSDRTRGLGPIQGRRRPYLTFGPWLYAPAFALLFWPPPFWPNTPGDDKAFDPVDSSVGDFSYGNAAVRAAEGAEPNADNQAAAYWFGLLYVTFYLTDTFSNVPYEALGPELSTSPQERSKLFFFQKLVNMSGMLAAAAAPSCLAYLIRWKDSSTLNVPCDYLYHPEAADDSQVIHGTHLPNQLAYTDTVVNAAGVSIDINRTAEICTASGGDFCFERLYQNGTHHWFEQSLFDIEDVCGAEGANATTLLSVDQYLTSSLASYQMAFLITAMAFGAWYALAMWNLAWFVKERPLPEGQLPVPLLSSIMRSLNNRAFRPLLIAWGLDGLGLAALVTMFPFYIRYIIRPDSPAAQAKGQYMDAQVCMAGCVFALLTMAILGSIAWLWVSRRFGKFAAWQAYNFINAVTNLAFFLPGAGDSWMVIIIAGVNGIPVGGQFLTNAVTSDVIDYDEFLNGVRSEGAFSVFATLIPKFVAIPASAVPLAVISMLGFIQPVNGVAQVQSSAVNSFISAVFVMLPCSCATVSFFVKFMYPIKKDRTCQQIQEGIMQHARGEEALDPLTDTYVEVRKFSPEDDKQALLMESYTAKQLNGYRGEVQALYDSVSSASMAEVDPKADSSPAASGLECTALSDKMRVLVATYTLTTAGSVVLTASTFSMLHDQAKAIVPILGCILFGFSCCLLGVACIRLSTAHALERVWLTDSHEEPLQPSDSAHDGLAGDAGPALEDAALVASARRGDEAPLLARLQLHISLLEQLISMKRRGAAGGWLDVDMFKASCKFRGRREVIEPVQLAVTPVDQQRPVAVQSLDLDAT